MKAVLVSFFESNNIGDLLISDLMYKKTKEHFNEVTKINYLNGREVSQKDGIKIESFKPEEPKREKSTKESIAAGLSSLKLNTLNYLYLSKIKNYQLDQFEEEIKDADVLVIGGGNMIFDIYERTLVAARFNQYIKIAEKYNKKIFAMSLGIGPFQTDYQADLATEALSKCDYVTFRDQKSYDIYKNKRPNQTKNVHVAVDPVFALPHLIENTNQDTVIGLNIINNPEYAEDNELYEKVVNGYVLLIESLINKTNMEIHLFSTETRDYEVIDEVYSRINNQEKVEVIHIKNFDELLELYSNISLLIAARMHSMIIAYTQMVPIVGLSWQPKVQAMFDIINDPESCFDLTEIAKDIEKILETSIGKINNKNISEMEQQLDVVQEKEQINEEILMSLSKKM